MGLRNIIIMIAVIAAFVGIMLYLAQAVRPNSETVVEIIPNDQFDR